MLAPTDVALWTPVPTTTSRSRGHVEALALANDAEAPMTPVEHATARAGHGLEGAATSTVAARSQAGTR